MMFIKVTISNGKTVRLNVQMIGDIMDSEKIKGGTNIGHLTHNNGGFNVKESPEQVIKLISEVTGVTVR